jgi:protein-disulfide isomerase
VAIIEYSDFQCPFCGAFARDTLPEIEQRYVKSGKVLLAFRNLPLASLHPFATKAAEAAECARRQGKFWQIHDRFFQNQQRLDEPSIRLSADASGVDPNSFNVCLDGQAATEVKQEVATAQKLGVSGTPTFFLGRIQPGRQVKVVKRLSGALPFAQFQTEIDAVLAPAVVASR